jgi:hypothetical protein
MREICPMKTSLAAMLSVRRGVQAIELYRAPFEAKVL